jgi:hypothetical protein
MHTVYDFYFDRNYRAGPRRAPSGNTVLSYFTGSLRVSCIIFEFCKILTRTPTYTLAYFANFHQNDYGTSRCGTLILRYYV